MQITDVRIRKISKEGKMKAIVSITLDGEFVVHDIKVIEGEKGLFIAMPSRRAGDGEYRDIAHPINSQTREMIQNIMEFHDKSAKDIMTHRKNINALDDTTLLKDAIVYMSEHSNSRYPVYHEDIDNIVGFIHIKDAMEHQNRAEYEAKSLMQIPKLVRSVAYIPETRGIDSLFQAMQTKKIHIAIVVDEYGQTAGLVTMEDILEEIVGNIFDEYDESEEFIQPQFDESILMDGLTPLDDVEEVLGIDLGDHAFETLNGYLTSLLGHIPTAEDKEINANGYCFQILSVEDNIIQKIRVEKIQ